MTPPEEREAWSHEDTPDILRDHITPLVTSRDRRKDLANRLRELYKIRVVADYIGSVPFSEDRVSVARKDAGYIVKFAEKLLVER